MTGPEFAEKVDWEGGVLQALEYGLKASDLNATNETEDALKSAWESLEYAFGMLQDDLNKASSIVDALLDDEDFQEEDD